MSDIKYPCLMIGQSSDTVVLFTERYKGTVKGTGNKHKPYAIGHYSDGWVMECFKPFVGVCYD